MLLDLLLKLKRRLSGSSPGCVHIAARRVASATLQASPLARVDIIAKRTATVTIGVKSCNSL